MQYLIIKSLGKKLSQEDAVLTLDNVCLVPLHSVKLLGITIDRHLTFSEHINITVKKCRGLLGILRRVADSNVTPCQGNYCYSCTLRS